MSGSLHLDRSLDHIRLMARENPCGWRDSVLDALAVSIDLLVGERTRNGVTLQQMSDYYHVTIRTIQRWRMSYKDFPEAIDPYAKTLSFPTDKVVEWKFAHKELF